MTSPAHTLLEHPLLITLGGMLPGFPATGQLCLVGGAVRDAQLERPVGDFDFASPGDPTPLARALAGQLAGHWFWLDAPRRQSRVVAGPLTCDFAPWRAATLAGDLAARDFTINAVALDLAGAGVLIDPLDGCGDLDRGILRAAGTGVLEQDPLRILKGIRHVAELGLHIEPATLSAMQAQAPRLAQVAPERLRLEVWRLLAAPHAVLALQALAASGTGTVLFGPGFAPALPSWLAAQSAAQQLFAGLVGISPHYATLLAEAVELGLDRQTLLLWHHVLRHLGPELPLSLARAWRFSRGGTQRLAALVCVSPGLWGELLELPPRPRVIAQWALQYGPDPLDLLMALALQSQEDTATVIARLSGWLELLASCDNLRQFPALVDSAWLTSNFALEGPALGMALAELRRAEIRGELENAADARRFAHQHFSAKKIDNQ
jgi:poly(A) polymerase